MEWKRQQIGEWLAGWKGRKGETEAWNGVAGACKRGLGAWERWRGWRL